MRVHLCNFFIYCAFDLQKMSTNSEKSKEKIEGAVVAEKAANDANKEDEKADLVSH